MSPVTRNSLKDVTCSIARTVNVMGDAWAWLIVRDVFVGVRRFDALCRDLGVSRKVLTERLAQLLDADILVKAPLEDGSPGFEYRLTTKGEDLVPILATLVTWGDRWEPTAGGPPIYIEHRACHGAATDVTCSSCGATMTADTLSVRPGPGGSVGPGTALLGAVLAESGPRTPAVSLD